MAGDWIKMRTDLFDDPKVICVARMLSEQPESISWLQAQGYNGGATQCNELQRYATIGALHRVWGTARRLGKIEGADLVLRYSRLADIDAMSGIPGFGTAMEFVGWAVEDKGLRLPNFREWNVVMTSTERSQARRHRKRAETSKKPNCNKTQRNATTEETETETETETKKKKNIPPKAVHHDLHADAYAEAFKTTFGIPYVWQKGDFPQLEALRKAMPDLTPSAFAGTAKRCWATEGFIGSVSKTIRGLATHYSQAIAELAPATVKRGKTLHDFFPKDYDENDKPRSPSPNHPVGCPVAEVGTH